MGEEIGVVASLRRYPVKSMMGEEVAEAEVTARGVAGDRAFALLDAETGKLVSAKRPRRWGRMLELAARLAPDGSALVTFPDGTSLGTSDPGLADALSEFLGRRVSVTSGSAEMLMFEEVWRGDLKDGAPPYGPAAGEEDGQQMIEAPASLGAPGGFFDAFAMHLLTTATLRRLGELEPDSAFDARRFRPNLVVDTGDASGFLENDWADRTVQIGGVLLQVAMPVPRCVMTTLPQQELPSDPGVLRAVTRHNRVAVLADRYPCAGVYAEVAAAGTVRVGDPVTLR